MRRCVLTAASIEEPPPQAEMATRAINPPVTARMFLARRRTFRVERRFVDRAADVRTCVAIGRTDVERKRHESRVADLQVPEPNPVGIVEARVGIRRLLG